MIHYLIYILDTTPFCLKWRIRKSYVINSSLWS